VRSPLSLALFAADAEAFLGRVASVHRDTILTNAPVRAVKKFSEEVVAPRVYDMDENEKMDPAIIKGLFEQGVRPSPSPTLHDDPSLMVTPARS